MPRLYSSCCSCEKQIIMMSCCKHGYPWRSLATCLYRPLLSAGLLGYIMYQHRYVPAGRPTLARPWLEVHRSTSPMSSPLLLQQCLTCLVRLIWMIFVIGGRWQYNCFLLDVVYKTCSIQFVVFLCNCQAFSPYASLCPRGASI